MLALEHARQHLARGQWALARPLLERAARSDPKDAEAAFLLARTLQMLGEREPAAYHAQRCVELRPGDANARVAAAELLQAVGKAGEAERLFRAGIAKFPALAAMHTGLINALRAQGRLGEAGDAAVFATNAFERDPLLAIVGAGALGESLRSREAAALVRRAVALATVGGPGDHRILRAAATMLLYCDDASETERASLHAALGRAFAAAFPAVPLAPRERHHPLRVGLVSPDFRDHAVARFLEPWLGRHDRGRVAIVGVPTLGPADDTSQRLRAACDEWVDVSALGDDAAVAAIRSAELDVAIDLGGWHVTARPSLFARRIAPRQLTWLGYAHATGLPTIDARLTDSIADPGLTGTLEPLLALEPCFVCFGPDPRTPPIEHAAAANREQGSSGAAGGTGGGVRFASFNAQQKITPATLDLWCRVLNAVPRSRLVLKARALADAGTRRVLDTHLRSRGVDPARVETLPHAGDYRSHLAHYNSCDLALDTMPYNGTTTTCEAMLMGLEVITLAGTHHAARVGASLLAAAGCGDSVAPDSDAFVRRCVDAAGAWEARGATERQAVKQARREALLASPLCDGTRFAASWQDAVWAFASAQGAG
ncbi:MAG TPA: hypothetical protein VF777_15120 [Phycisphaerales bacterium]